MAKIERRKVATALIMVPPIALLIAWGPPEMLHLMVVLATFLGLREYYKLVLPDANWMERLTGIGLGLILSVVVSLGEAKEIFLFLAIALFILSLLSLATSRDLSSATSKLGLALFGILYVGFLLAHVSLIRNMANGRLWVLLLVVTVWAGDIFALLFGSFFGRHKLYPKISPNKTFEGLGGAMVGSIIAALIFSMIFIPRLEKISCILLAIGLGVLGQFGDFTESMLKRGAQVKDSGTLIPGHGGMLDRVDSFLFSAPLLHYSLLFLLKETP